MSRRRSVLTIILALAMVSAYMPTQAEGSNVSEVSHSPEVPKSGEEVEITLRFDNATNITNIKIICCTIDPFRCEMPANMTQESADESPFIYTITKKYDPGTKMGFKFKVTYQNSTIHYMPKSQGDSYLHSVAGPFEGFYYFTYSIAEEEFPILYLLIPILVIIIAIAALLSMKKRKGRKHEKEN